MLIRRAKPGDLDSIYELAVQGGIGITSLPKKKDVLGKRLTWSFNSLDEHCDLTKNQYYLFVMEDPATQLLVGISAIESLLGQDVPNYTYKLIKKSQICYPLSIRKDHETLHLVNDSHGKSEICTLYLHKDYRKDGNGLLLSRSRFLFIAQFPERFSNLIIAELRGVSDEQGRSPFWENLGKHFFNMNYEQADELTLATNKQIISDLFPRDPVYVSLLNPEAQAVIGQPHPSSRPAMRIIEKEGFRYQGYLDIFDAGPLLEVPTSEIRTVKSSQLYTLRSITDEVYGERFLVANSELDFRATSGGIVYNPLTATCVMSKQMAELLQINCGSQVRIAPFND